MPVPLKTIADFVVRDSSFDSSEPSVVALPDGRAVISISAEFNGDTNVDNRFITFTGTTINGSGTWLFGAPGDAIEEMFQVAPTTGNLALGVYAYAASSGAQHDIYARFFNPATTETIGPSAGFALATNVGDEVQPTAVALQNGNFAAFWFNATTNSVVGTVVDPLGNPGGQVNINSSAASVDFGIDSLLLANGNVVVAWNGTLRIMAPNLAPVTGQITLPGSDTSETSLALLADGRFVAASESGDGSSFAIRYTIYNQDGTQSFTSFLDVTSARDDDNVQVTGLADGRFMMVWQDTGPNQIQAQIVRADGTLDGDIFVVNTDTTQDVRNPAIATLADGRVIVTWQVDSATNNEDLIRAAVYDPREGGIFLTGTSFADQWVGSQFGDALFGGTGNDNIQGGLGADTLAGEDGTDSLFGQDGNDFLYGGGGLDTLNGGIGDDFLLGELGVDTLLGGDGNDNLLGGDGNDLMYGEGNDDGLFGEAGDDLILGGAGADTVFGGAGTDSINGEAGADTLRGETGNDTINGGSEGDTLLGGDGFDTLNGDSGADTLFGEEGNDTLFGGSENDVLLGGNGLDDLNGNAGDDQLFGEGGNDNLYGEDGADTLQGGAGNDVMLGGANNDTLHGGLGNDAYYGEAGNNIFAFVRAEMANGDADSIWDWDAPSDTIQIFGATAANISTAVVGGDVLIAVALVGGGTANIFVRGTTDNAAVFNDIQFI